MKIFILIFLSIGFLSCATQKEKPKPKAALAKVLFSRFDHIQSPREIPFESTFLNPVINAQPSTKKEQVAAHKSVLQTTAKIAFSVYQHTWSRMDGSTCNFSPTCSAFGLHATYEFGFWGMVLTMGRLQKDHSAFEFYKHLSLRLHDPIENYTFWLREARKDDFSSYLDPAHAWFQHIKYIHD